jgi:hypothetical protein
LVNRSQLEDQISQRLGVIIKNRNRIKEVQTFMFNKHKVLYGTTNSYIMSMVPLSSLSVEELFWIVEAINDIIKKEDLNFDLIQVSYYFSNGEIIHYSKSEAPPLIKNVYPITFPNVLKVSDDQWVTTIDANMLKDLYDNQVINYNVNTQRNLTQKVINGKINEIITVKEKSVKEIRKLLEDKLYIPDALTLNLNLDNPDLIYTIGESSIVIKSGQTDIIDGFHRFRATMLAKSSNPNFNCTFPLNLTNFDEDKAQNYIVQRDKRNPINKAFLKSIDMTNNAAIVIRRLNEDPKCYFRGQITNSSESYINLSDLVAITDYCFKNIQSIQSQMQLKKLLNEALNAIVEDEPGNLRKWSFKEIAFVIRTIQYFNNKKEYTNDKVVKMFNASNYALGKEFERHVVNKKLFSQIDTMLKEEL